jgi:adenylate kinase family enzyme
MQRVLVIGSPGAGKSTLARELADRTGVPLVHLDAEHWRAGWVEPPPHEWRGRLAELISRDHWIMDGNYGGSMDARLARTDTVVWLDYSTGLCLSRAMRRILRFRGRSRPDMAAGCPEQWNFEFLRYIAAFRRAKRPGIVARLRNFAGETVHLHKPADAERWLATIRSSRAQSRDAAHSVSTTLDTNETRF